MATDKSDNTMTPKSDTPPSSDSISRSELNEILAERDRKHAEEMAEVRLHVPQAMVAANSGGPGSDNHQRSWSLAEQEVAARGDVLEHWEISNG